MNKIKYLSFSSFWQGFRAGIPMWLAAAPFAIAYIVTARQAGLSNVQTQLMSLSIYSAASQIVLYQLMIAHNPILVIAMTVLAMNIHQLFYGLSLTRHFQLNRLEKAILPFPLTDFAFGVTIARENVQVSFLLGIELSIFLAWNTYTAIAIFFSSLFTDIQGLHLDFIIPLTFFMLLITSIKARLDLIVAIFSILLAAICSFLGLGSLTILLLCVVVPLFGIALIKSPAFEGLQ